MPHIGISGRKVNTFWGSEDFPHGAKDILAPQPEAKIGQLSGDVERDFSKTSALLPPMSASQIHGKWALSHYLVFHRSSSWRSRSRRTGCCETLGMFLGSILPEIWISRRAILFDKTKRSKRTVNSKQDVPDLG